jgi:PAS domain S-box-containing protein
MLETLLDLFPDAAFVINLEGKITAVTAYAESLFGFSREDLLDQSIEMLMPEKARQPHRNYFSTFLASPNSRWMKNGKVITARRSDGNSFPVLIRLLPFWTMQTMQILVAIMDVEMPNRFARQDLQIQSHFMESVEYERLRLAQELHDGPLQELYGVYYQILEADKDRASQVNGSKLDDISRTILGLIAQLRSISENLRPPALAPYGLEKAIRSHKQELLKAAPGLQVELDLMPDGRLLKEPVRMALFRIYQHAASNVIRHAGAKKLKVFFTYNAEEIILEISDDGYGFEPPKRLEDLMERGHFGLVGTAERARAVGGIFQIKSSPGEGTLMRVIIPNQRESNPYCSTYSSEQWSDSGLSMS